MGTEKSVGDEKRKLTAEELGGLQRKTNEIVKRIENRSILFKDAISGMQNIIEGKSRRLSLGLIPQKKWWEKDGVIYLKLVSDGTTGRDWIIRLERQGFKVSEWAKQFLLSKDFKPTTGTVYTIAVLRGSLFTSNNRITKKIRSEAEGRKMVTPNLEIACLIREMLSDKEIDDMGLSWIVTFHKPIEDSDGDLGLLCAHRGNDGSLLDVNYKNYNRDWDETFGFVFEVSQVSL